MKIEVINGIRVITPNDNMWLCNENDKVISDKVWLGVNADETMWKEITETEKARLETLWNEETTPENEATEMDYISALQEMGVNFNE
jgi:hypothetical protein